MSFSGKSFWMPRDSGCLADGEIGYDNSSRIEPKRGHQWFMDTTGPELFSNKKQAIEAVSNRPVLGSSHLNASPWHNTSSFQSVPGQFSERLFGSETVHTVNVVDRNVPCVSGGDMNLGRKDINDIYGRNSTMGLSVSHGIEDTSRSISFGGIRKIKVNQVRVANMDISSSSGQSYSIGDESAISLGIYNKTDSSNISLGPTNDNRDNNAISVGRNFSKTDGSFISMGQAFNKGGGNFMLMGHNYTKGSQTILAMSPPFDKVDANFITIGPSCGKGDSNAISMSSSYDKGHEDYITMPPNYNKANENFVSMASSYSKEDHNSISVALTYDKIEPNNASTDSAQDKGDSNIISMGDNYKGDGNNISFGGFHDESETDPAGSIISSYDMLMSDQNSAQTSEVPIQKDSVEPTANQVVNNTQKASPKTENVSKGKEPKPSKKVPPNNFPSNVKSLLSTGMLDGVPVKYVSWSREKNLKGTIKGTGYLCGCNECNFSKALNAYEFERHANCKTKHPNNHIYFENGKTIYAVVQELKNTPQEMLFDAIKNVTGSQINQKNFHIWKASYQAATREPLILGLVIWFDTLQTRSELLPIWSAQPPSVQSLLQNKFNCCGYISPTQPHFVVDQTCPKVASATQAAALSKPGCVTPFSNAANAYLDVIFTGFFGIAGLDAIMVMFTVMVLRYRHEQDRYRAIDDKNGYGAGI